MSARLREMEDLAVVIAGASSGVGRATAQAFARRGARLALAARAIGPLRDAAAGCVLSLAYEAARLRSLRREPTSQVFVDVVGRASMRLATW